MLLLVSSRSHNQVLTCIPWHCCPLCLARTYVSLSKWHLDSIENLSDTEMLVISILSVGLWMLSPNH